MPLKSCCDSAEAPKYKSNCFWNSLSDFSIFSWHVLLWRKKCFHIVSPNKKMKTAFYIKTTSIDSLSTNIAQQGSKIARNHFLYHFLYFTLILKSTMSVYAFNCLHVLANYFYIIHKLCNLFCCQLGMWVVIENRQSSQKTLKLVSGYFTVITHYVYHIVKVYLTINIYLIDLSLLNISRF